LAGEKCPKQPPRLLIDFESLSVTWDVRLYLIAFLFHLTFNL